MFERAIHRSRATSVSALAVGGKVGPWLVRAKALGQRSRIGDGEFFAYLTHRTDLGCPTQPLFEGGADVICCVESIAAGEFEADLRS